MAEVRDEPALWRARLRWQLAGAWQGPAFVVATLVEAVLIDRLPIAGESGPGFVGAFLGVAFVNLGIVGLCGPLGALLLRRRRPVGMPMEIWRDRVGSGTLATGVALILALGLLHHGTVDAAQDDYRVAVLAAEGFLEHQGPPQYRGEFARADVWKAGDGLYRTCVPGRDSGHAYCMLVRTGNGTPTVAEDPDQQPNDRVAGADNPGRQDG